MNFSLANFERRNKEMFLEHSRVADEMGICHYGVNGSSMLQSFIVFPDGLPIDYMHLLCLGLFKSILNMWFDNKFKDESFFLGNYFKYFLKFFRFFKNIVKGKTNLKQLIQKKINKFNLTSSVKRKSFDLNDLNRW